MGIGSIWSCRFIHGFRAAAVAAVALVVACGGGSAAGPHADAGRLDSSTDGQLSIDAPVGDAPGPDLTPVPRDTAPPCSEGGTCGAGLTCCGGLCVDTKRDPLNCGMCGQACASGQFCTGTACHEAVFANVCDNPSATVVKDPFDIDNTAALAIGGALAGSCVPPTSVSPRDQNDGDVLDPAGRPLGGGSISYLTGGGAFGQHLVAYLEKAALSAIYFTGDGMTAQFHNRRTGEIVVTTPYSALGESHDYFFVQMTVEPMSGTLCVSAAGMFAPGTVAAGFWVPTEMVPKRATYSDSWYVYEWTDSGDKIPNAADTFRLVAHGR
jgi:hypothetical protein